MGKLIAVLVFIIALAAGAYYWTSFDRVDPGNVGILVDYGDGSIDPVTETRLIWIGRYQKLVEYPAGEQTLVMDVGSEGKVKGDDSTNCLTNDSQNIRIDSLTNWRIDPSQVVRLYQLRRDVPLVGPTGRDAPGNYIEDIIIRNHTRSAIYKVCATYGWADILGAKQTQFQEEVDREVKRTANPEGVIVSNVTIRQRFPSEAVQALMNARLEGQRQEEQSRFLAAQNERQQKIEQDAAKAAGEKARIDAEARAKIELANITAAAEQAKVKSAAEFAQATTAAEIARVKANQEADAVRAKGQAEAESLKAQASVVTKELVELERARRWDGKLPTTIMGQTPEIVNQIPLQR